MSTPTDDRIRDALADLLDLAPPVPLAPPAAGVVPSVGPPEHRRWPVLAAAAAVVAVGIGGLVVATRPVPVDEQIPSTVVGRLDQYTGWYLPTYIPEGFELTGITAEPPSPREDTPDWWSRLGADGEVDALFAVRAFPVEEYLPDDAEFTGDGATVHGLAAVVEIESAEALSVTWVEGDWYVWASTAYLTEAEALDVAEAVRVNPESGRGEFPSGAPHRLELRTLDADVPANGVHLDIGLRRIDGALGDSVDIFVAPNTFQYTPGTLRLSLPRVVWQPVVVGGIDAIAYQPDQRGAPSAVKWVDGGLMFTIRGELEIDELVRIAAGLRPVTPGDVLAEGEQITARVRRLPVLDETMFGDGTRVTVHTHGSDGAAAICVESVPLQCDRPNYVGNAAAEVHDAIFTAFEIGGQDVIFGWRRGDEEPTLVDGFDGFDGPTTGSATIDDLVHTELGHFVRVSVPIGEPRPMLQYSDITYNTPSRHPTRIVDFGS